MLQYQSSNITTQLATLCLTDDGQIFFRKSLDKKVKQLLESNGTLVDYFCASSGIKWPWWLGIGDLSFHSIMLMSVRSVHMFCGSKLYFRFLSCPAFLTHNCILASYPYTTPIKKGLNHLSLELIISTGDRYTTHGISG